MAETPAAEAEPATVDEPAFPADAEVRYEQYASELQLPLMQRLIEKDLSEPYSVFTYRYFVNNWPNLTLLGMVRLVPSKSLLLIGAPSNTNKQQDMLTRTHSYTHTRAAASAHTHTRAHNMRAHTT
jgi:hypothetical protein